jgi:hypothetical protein
VQLTLTMMVSRFGFRTRQSWCIHGSFENFLESLRKNMKPSVKIAGNPPRFETGTFRTKHYIGNAGITC